MQSVKLNGIELEYERAGSGEPVLLIDPVVPGAFLPLLSERALADGYELIRYHKRGWAGSTHTPPPVSIADHAADAAALLDGLGISRAHVAGHSSGAAIAMQLALDRPEAVRTLVLLEPSPLSLSIGKAFVEQAGPVFEAYANGDHTGAFARFMSAVSGLDWPVCREILEDRVPGAAEQAVADADTLFGIELPSLTTWPFEAAQLAAIEQPVLSVLGSETLPLWVEVADFLRGSLPHVEECRIEGVGHLLQIQDPEAVARAIAGFLARNPLEQAGSSPAVGAQV